MKIFADLHHFDLYYSLQLLFEKRLGAELYRPIGTDWHKEGYWKVYDQPDTVKQYLTTDQSVTLRDVHGFKLPERWCVNANYRYEDGIYYVVDPSKNKVQRGITLEKFKDLDFDIVISSIPQHIQSFNLLIQRFQPKAKHIFQVGNSWGQLPGIKNILASCNPFPVQKEINVCFYHQEFDLETFKYEPPVNHNIVHSFIHYMREQSLFEQYKNAFVQRGWSFTRFGAGQDKDLCLTTDIANAEREAAFIWHVKPEGDGYGHIGHNAGAVGRPLLVKAQYYKEKMLSALLQDGITCIDIGKGSFEENCSLIQHWSKPENHIKMCKAMNKRFHAVVNFDNEFIRIKKFLENLL